MALLNDDTILLRGHYNSTEQRRQRFLVHLPRLVPERCGQQPPGREMAAGDVVRVCIAFAGHVLTNFPAALPPTESLGGSSSG